MSCALFNAAVDPEKAVGISAGTNPGSAVHENCAQLMKVITWSARHEALIAAVEEAITCKPFEGVRVG